MKEVKLVISDRVFNEIRSMLTLRRMADSFYGVADEALKKIISSIEDGDEICELIFKEERKNEGREE